MKVRMRHLTVSDSLTSLLHFTDVDLDSMDDDLDDEDEDPENEYDEDDD